MEASQIQRKTKDGPQARRLCQTANLWRIKILAQWCRSRHDEPPGFAMLNLTRLHLGIAHESQFQGLGIRPGSCRCGYHASSSSAFFSTVFTKCWRAGVEASFQASLKSLACL